jgi:hypothetical protein
MAARLTGFKEDGMSEGAAELGGELAAMGIGIVWVDIGRRYEF